MKTEDMKEFTTALIGNSIELGTAIGMDATSLYEAVHLALDGLIRNKGLQRLMKDDVEVIIDTVQENLDGVREGLVDNDGPKF